MNGHASPYEISLEIYSNKQYFSIINIFYIIFFIFIFQHGKSVVHVRALTYCDIHTIQVDRLKEVLEFYKPFAHTFSRNLALTFDLSKRVVFAKVRFLKYKVTHKG